jgi:hypothetical protein
LFLKSFVSNICVIFEAQIPPGRRCALDSTAATRCVVSSCGFLIIENQ